MARSGDGSVKYTKATPQQLANLNGKQEEVESENLIWGWDDVDMKDDDKKMATVINKSN